MVHDYLVNSWVNGDMSPDLFTEEVYTAITYYQWLGFCIAGYMLYPLSMKLLAVAYLMDLNSRRDNRLYGFFVEVAYNPDCNEKEQLKTFRNKMQLELYLTLWKLKNFRHFLNEQG